MRNQVMFLILLFAVPALGSTTYVGRIRNVTPYKNEQITVQLYRDCEWFCDQTHWHSPEVAVKPDGTWKIVSPHDSAGNFTLTFKTPNASAQHEIYYADFHNKWIQTTLIETEAAKIPVRLQNGDDAGPWISNVVAERKIELFEDFATDWISPRTETITGSYLVIPETLFAYLGWNDFTVHHSLYTVEPDNSRSTKSKMSRTATLSRSFYTSIPEIVVDNSLDSPLFDGHYAGNISPADFDNYKAVEGEIQVSCRNGALEGEFVHSGVPTKFQGKCALGSASFDLEVEFPPMHAGSAPLRKTLQFTSDDISGSRIYFYQLDSSGYRYNGNFSKAN